MKDLWAALKSAWYYFRREYKRRQEKSSKRVLKHDPFTPALENTIRRVINEGNEGKA